jgi:hypothetical protein
MNTPKHATDEQIEKLFDDGLAPARAVAAAMDRIESLMHTTKRHRYAFERVPVGHDMGWRCWDELKDNADDADYGYGLTQDEAYADYLRNCDKPPRRMGRVIHSSAFEPPTIVDDRDVDFDDGLTDEDAR